MIVANLATYPPRRKNLKPVVEALLPQVDQMNLVLNEYEGALPEFEGITKLNQIVPQSDTKDVGKFYPDVSGADYVLFVDDDLIYPSDYVARTVERFEALGAGSYLGGYHASLYYKPRFTFDPSGLNRYLKSLNPRRVADFREAYQFNEALEQPTVVDQIATNAAIIRGVDMPPLSFMADSQKFVDVRLARWCFERGIVPVALPKDKDWLGEVTFDETIYHGFTRKNPRHVADEILSYAFKIPGRGKALTTGAS
ncbi:glycosyltransferase [Ferrimonas balearica]|nr:glycosyltransferase [Ferrimonas balearica]